MPVVTPALLEASSLDDLRATYAAMAEDVRGLIGSNSSVLRDALGQLRALRARISRDDVNTFCEFAIADEKTGTAIVQAPIHEKFHALADRYQRLILWSHIESGKTQQISIARTIWRLGNDPTVRCLVGSGTHGQAVKVVRTVGNHIATNPRVREVFPELLPDKRAWSNNAITVIRPTRSKDPSLAATSIGTMAAQGSRLEHVVLDDVLTLENTRTADQRERTDDWYHSTIGGRYTEDATAIIVGTAFNPRDFMHTRAASDEWFAARFPVINDSGDLTWPTRWSSERIEAKRKELGPDEFARQMLCLARDESAGRFRKQWLDHCILRGAGRAPAFALHSVPVGYRTYTGVDLGVRRHSNSDLTVLFTVIIHPNEDREVLCVESGRWAAKEIVNRIIDAHNRFHSIVIVESNAAQLYIVDFTAALSAVPVRAFNTGKNKIHPEFGIEGIATEMSNGKWIIPSRGGAAATKEMSEWIAEMLYYDPAAHAGDRLMASWFAREGARTQPTVRAQVGWVDLLSR